MPAYTTANTHPKFKAAIEKSLADTEAAVKTQATIKPGEPEGFMGIPGAPKPNLIMGLLWAIWVGWIFSTVGAFGGIMAGVGHITIFGLGDYAKNFGKGNPVNKLVTDSIRVSNQWLVGLSAPDFQHQLLQNGPPGGALGYVPGHRWRGWFLADSGADGRQGQFKGLYRLLRAYRPASGIYAPAETLPEDRPKRRKPKRPRRHLKRQIKKRRQYRRRCQDP